MTKLRAPFPYFGGKRAVAHLVWDALGNVSHYIEPFFGSGAVMLNCPFEPKLTTVNDADGLLANFWRAVRGDPEQVAEHANWPVNEADLHARHLWLVRQRENLTSRLMADPDWFDAKAAGWWVWGASCWIGSGWCSGDGCWTEVNGVFVKASDTGQGVNRQRPHLGNAGRGVMRQLPHLGDAGRGVKRRLPQHMTRGEFLAAWFSDLAAKLSETRVVCGDWSRVTGPCVRRAARGICGVFLDPPYDQTMRDNGCYSIDTNCAADVLAWCMANTETPNLRIVLAGYHGEHNALEDMGWRVTAWKTQGGYAGGRGSRAVTNSALERLWFSPSCLDVGQKEML